MTTPTDLFEDVQSQLPPTRSLGASAMLLRSFALPCEALLLQSLRELIAQAPWRHMTTPGGRRMSVAMSNCGTLGWISDRHGYRYQPSDPLNEKPWPAMPASFRQLASAAADAVGFGGFVPDACLINRYVPGTRLSLHQDRDERDFSQPIVSVSLGLPAVFLFGGLQRSERPARVPLAHGDVVVWGGVDRVRFHGVMVVKPGRHALLGEVRINLTLRKAG